MFDPSRPFVSRTFAALFLGLMHLACAAETDQSSVATSDEAVRSIRDSVPLVMTCEASTCSVEIDYAYPSCEEAQRQYSAARLQFSSLAIKSDAALIHFELEALDKDGKVLPIESSLQALPLTNSKGLTYYDQELHIGHVAPEGVHITKLRINFKNPHSSVAEGLDAFRMDKLPLKDSDGEPKQMLAGFEVQCLRASNAYKPSYEKFYIHSQKAGVIAIAYPKPCAATQRHYVTFTVQSKTASIFNLPEVHPYLIQGDENAVYDDSKAYEFLMAASFYSSTNNRYTFRYNSPEAGFSVLETNIVLKNIEKSVLADLEVVFPEHDYNHHFCIVDSRSSIL